VSSAPGPPAIWKRACLGVERKARPLFFSPSFGHPARAATGLPKFGSLNVPGFSPRATRKAYVHVCWTDVGSCIVRDGKKVPAGSGGWWPVNILACVFFFSLTEKVYLATTYTGEGACSLPAQA
jgi:hypothetical protein